jgi:hypothetical protein
MAIEAQFFTLNHVIRGFVDTAGDRLSDILNKKNETALYITKAQLFCMMSAGKTPPTQIPDLRLEKSFLMAALPMDSDVTHKSLFRKTTGQSYGITVLLPNYELRGRVFMSERLDLRRGFVARAEDFIPMTSAMFIYTPAPQITVHANTIIFNKHHVGFLGEHPQVRDMPTNPVNGNGSG